MSTRLSVRTRTTNASFKYDNHKNIWAFKAQLQISRRLWSTSFYQNVEKWHEFRTMFSNVFRTLGTLASQSVRFEQALNYSLILTKTLMGIKATI